MMEAIRLRTTFEVEKIVQKTAQKTYKIMKEYLKQLNQHFSTELQKLADKTRKHVYFTLKQSTDCPAYHDPVVYICNTTDDIKKDPQLTEVFDQLKRYGIKIETLPFKPKFKKGTIHYKPKNVGGSP